MTYTLSNVDIFQFLVKNSLLRHAAIGIYPINKIPRNRDLNKQFIIINSDPAYLPGEHWFCIYFPDSGIPEFFDSLGNFPNYYSTDLLSILGAKFIYNCQRIQPKHSSTCGLYCLYYIYHRFKGLNFVEILQDFSNYLDYNDNIVVKFYEKYM